MTDPAFVIDRKYLAQESLTWGIEPPALAEAVFAVAVEQLTNSLNEGNPVYFAPDTGTIRVVFTGMDRHDVMGNGNAAELRLTLDQLFEGITGEEQDDGYESAAVAFEKLAARLRAEGRQT